MKRSLNISGGSLPNYIVTRDEMLERAQSVSQGLREGWLKLNIGTILPPPLKQAKHMYF